MDRVVNYFLQPELIPRVMVLVAGDTSPAGRRQQHGRKSMLQDRVIYSDWENG